METDKLKSYLYFLEKASNDYSSARKKTDKEIVENRVRTFSQGMDLDIYLEMNEGAASGLFKHGFFESDLTRAISLLREKVKEK